MVEREHPQTNTFYGNAAMDLPIWKFQYKDYLQFWGGFAKKIRLSCR
jgi:hypothetical protein